MLFLKILPQNFVVNILYLFSLHIKFEVNPVKMTFLWYRKVLSLTIVRTLKEDQPLRLLLNFFFYHFNLSEPTYKSQHIKLLDVIAACNQVNVNALN